MKTKCKYLEKLLKKIILLNIKIKSDDRYTNISKIHIIEPQDFIHKCLVNIGIFCWKNAYLFSFKNLKSSEKQYHLNLIEKNIRKIIKNNIRDITPFEIILNLNQHNDSDEDVIEDTTNYKHEPLKKQQKPTKNKNKIIIDNDDTNYKKTVKVVNYKKEKEIINNQYSEYDDESKENVSENEFKNNNFEDE